jgi:hypothetical protein
MSAQAGDKGSHGVKDTHVREKSRAMLIEVYMTDKKVFPQVTIIMPGKNQTDTINSLLGCITTQAEIIFCADHVGEGMTDCADNVGEGMSDCADRVGEAMSDCADHVGVEILDCASHVGEALARAKGDYICILPAGTLLHEAYLSYPIAYLERHQEFDYSVCDPTKIAGQGSKEGIHTPAFNSLQITDYFLGHSTVEIAAFIVRKAFLAETGLLLVTANATFPELLILPFLAFGYGVHIAKSLYTAEKTFIVSEKLPSYISEAHDIIERFPIPASDVRELLCGFDFMTTKKLLSVYDCDTALTFSNYVCRSVNNAFHPSPHITHSAIINFIKANKALLLTALNFACAEEYVKIMKPTGHIVVFAPLTHSAIKIKELLRRTVYEPDLVWAMNADGVTAAAPDIPSLTGNDIVVVSRRYASLEREFSPATVVSIQEALQHCVAFAFPTLCDGNTTIRFSSGYFYDY